MHINERTICSSVFLIMSSSRKGNKIELATFLNWGKDAIIGYKIYIIVHGFYINLQK